MEEELMLGDLDIQENAVIDLVIPQEGGAATQMDPAIVELSKKYNHDKKVCRKCYATLPPRATKCRKRARRRKRARKRIRKRAQTKRQWRSTQRRRKNQTL